MIRGLLLCGGASVRFGGDKLLACLPGDDRPLAVLAARSLIEGVGNVLAVLRPADASLAGPLAAAGCDILEAPESARGLGASLSAGVRASAGAKGWLVALGDMPRIRPTTHEAVAFALAQGALLAAAVDAVGRRGHPVAFSARLQAELAALDGDAGAREVVRRHHEAFAAVRVDDPGIFFDVDVPGDLAGESPARG